MRAACRAATVMASLLATTHCHRASPPTGGTRTVDGQWFSFEVPASWTARPIRSESERQASVAAYISPRDDGGGRAGVILMRPQPFAGTLSAWVDAQRPGVAQLGARISHERDTQLDGVSAHAVEAVVDTPSVTFHYWMFVRDGMGSLLQCSVPTKSTFPCATIAASFRFRGPVARGDVGTAIAP